MCKTGFYLHFTFPDWNICGIQYPIKINEFDALILEILYLYFEELWKKNIAKYLSVNFGLTFF